MDSQANPKGTRRRMKVVLVASLALNLLFIGTFAGAAWRFGGGPDARGNAWGAMQGYGAPYMRALPREERRAQYRGFREKHPQLSKQSRRAHYQRMLVALRADPFVLDEAQAILDAQESAAQAVQTTVQEGWLNYIAEMSGPARLEYADALEEAIKRGPDRERKKPQPRE